MSNWKSERSSGYAGWRCQTCGTWRYDNAPLVCDCKELPTTHLGDITNSTLNRICAVLTSVGIKEYKDGLKSGLTPLQSFHKLNQNCKAREVESKERERQTWIDSGCLDHALLSPREYVEILGACAARRWQTYRKDEIKQILFNWRSKTLKEAAAKFVEKEWKEWPLGDKYDNVFKGNHIQSIEKAIEYGFPYNEESAKYYEIH